jgi:hypothetical protein
MGLLRRPGFWVLVVVTVLVAGYFGARRATPLPDLAADRVVIQIWRGGGFLPSRLYDAHPLLTVYGDGRVLLFPDQGKADKRQLQVGQIPAGRLRSLLRQTAWKAAFARAEYQELCMDCGYTMLIWDRPGGLRSSTLVGSPPGWGAGRVRSAVADWLHVVEPGTTAYVPEQATLLVEDRSGIDAPPCPAGLPALPADPQSGRYGGQMTVSAEAVRSLVGTLGGYLGRCSLGAATVEMAIVPVPDLRQAVRGQAGH